MESSKRTGINFKMDFFIITPDGPGVFSKASRVLKRSLSFLDFS